MAADSVESEEIKKLYENSTALDKAIDSKDIGNAKYEEVYRGILNGTKGATKTKCLAAQLIPRYFKYFPKLSDESLNALMDLCEEEDTQTRILAVRAFPIICKDTPSAISKGADILGQLLQTDLQLELDNVKHCLVALLKIDVKSVMTVLFQQLMNRDDPIRERIISFLKEKFLPQKNELLNEDSEKHFAECIKKSLADVTESEFRTFMDMLRALKIYQGENAKELLEVLAEQADLNSEFKPADTDNIERLISCMNLALPFFKKGITTGKFLTYLADKVMPEFDKLSEPHKLGLLKCLAEFSPFASTDNAKVILPVVFRLFESHLPLEQDVVKAPKINFTYVEGLLYLFNVLAGKTPGSLPNLIGIAPVYTGQPSDSTLPPDAKEKQAAFYARLKFLTGPTEEYVKKLKDALKNFSAAEAEKKSAASIALSTTQNIQMLIQNLLKPKPTFGKLGIKPSWLKEDAPNAQVKRKGEDATESQQKTKKQREIYVPPARRGGGSSNRGSSRGGGRGGRGRGFRGGRGRGFR